MSKFNDVERWTLNKRFFSMWNPVKYHAVKQKKQIDKLQIAFIFFGEVELSTSLKDLYFEL